MTGNSRQEPPVTSTNEYLLKQIKEDRVDMARSLRELQDAVTVLVDHYDAEMDLKDQSESVLNGFADLVELSSIVTFLSVKLSGLEEVPRVG
jgi:hypothetical protein